MAMSAATKASLGPKVPLEMQRLKVQRIMDRRINELVLLARRDREQLGERGYSDAYYTKLRNLRRDIGRLIFNKPNSLPPV